MVKPSKIYQLLLESRSSVPFRDFQRVLKVFGFTLDRINGSHHIYMHPAVPRPLSIQPHGNEVKAYQRDQFLRMVEEFGIKIAKT